MGNNEALNTRVAALESQLAALQSIVAALSSRVDHIESQDREPQTVHRDAGTGRFVSEEAAAADPDGTVRERR